LGPLCGIQLAAAEVSRLVSLEHEQAAVGALSAGTAAATTAATAAVVGCSVNKGI
jgi:hypothetical protein